MKLDMAVSEIGGTYKSPAFAGRLLYEEGMADQRKIAKTWDGISRYVVFILPVDI